MEAISSITLMWAANISYISVKIDQIGKFLWTSWSFSAFRD